MLGVRFDRGAVDGGVEGGEVLIRADARHIPLKDNVVDAIVTDPPYGLKFMGKEWDHGIPGIDFWLEGLRVCKPGAHLLAFGGTRTFHRLTCAIEDAGWEIRDCVMWLYGSGFPKSLDVSKAIDKEARAAWLREHADELREFFPSNSFWDWTDGGHSPSDTWWKRIKELAGGGHLDRQIIALLEKSPGWFTSRPQYEETISRTDAAKEWQGWGTALKPAWEPIIMARKPIEGTVAQNVQKWGTGAINVDECRIGTEEVFTTAHKTLGDGIIFGKSKPFPASDLRTGRWPANVIHDGSDEVVGIFPSETRSGHIPRSAKTKAFFGNAPCLTADMPNNAYGDSGSAARFFYTAKASSSERGKGNNHPTVKPIALMEYLIKLVTRPGSIILDPFCGSGSTAIAAQNLGRTCIALDLNYQDLAAERIGGSLFKGVVNSAWA